MYDCAGLEPIVSHEGAHTSRVACVSFGSESRLFSAAQNGSGEIRCWRVSVDERLVCDETLSVEGSKGVTGLAFVGVGVYIRVVAINSCFVCHASNICLAAGNPNQLDCVKAACAFRHD